MNLPQTLARRLAGTSYGQKVMAAEADLDAFRQRPTPRFYIGVGLIVLSYLLGGVAAMWGGYTLFEGQTGGWLMAGVAVAVFVVVHLIFVAGAWLAGANYAAVGLHWLTRKYILLYGN